MSSLITSAAITSLPLALEPRTLYSHIEDDNLLILDLSAPEIYQHAHVPGAINADSKGLMRGEGPIPNKLPSVEQLSEYFSSLGLTDDKQVVIYDDQMGPWAGRMLWTLDVLGHEKTSVLNGQFAAWVAAGLTLDDTQNKPVVSNYKAQIKHPELIADIDYITAHIDDEDSVIWDARSDLEYSGERKVNCAKPGHIPNALSFDWTKLRMSSGDYSLKPRKELLEALAKKGITPDKEVITHCQTHRRSGFTYFAARVLGFTRIRCYDGSWFEWGNHPDTPVDKTLIHHLKS